MKKEVKVAIAIVLSIWFFFMGFEIGKYVERKNGKTPAVSPTAAPTTVAPPTAEPVTQIPATDATEPVQTTAQEPATQAPETTQADVAPSADATTAAPDTTKSGDPSSMSKAEIVQAVSKAVNGAKATKDMKARNVEKVTINLTDLSLKAAMGIVNSIIQRLAGEDVANYNFVGGQSKATDDSGAELEDGQVFTPDQVIPPKNAAFSLTEDGVASASAEKSGDNTVYKIKLVEENTSFTSPVPKFNSACFGYLDLTSIDVGGATITDANMHYPGTEMTFTVNGDGKLVKADYNMPMDGNGSAKIIGMNGSATFEGGDTESWEFTY